MVIDKEIGDVVYTIDNYNQYYDKPFEEYEHKRVKSNSNPYIKEDKLIIREFIIQGFIVDQEGVFPAEDGNDGWNKITVYNSINDKFYYDLSEAIKDLNEI
jgi:hypothetical protein